MTIFLVSDVNAVMTKRRKEDCRDVLALRTDQSDAIGDQFASVQQRT